MTLKAHEGSQQEESPHQMRRASGATTREICRADNKPNMHITYCIQFTLSSFNVKCVVMQKMVLFTVHHEDLLCTHARAHTIWQAIHTLVPPF